MFHPLRFARARKGTFLLALLLCCLACGEVTDSEVADWDTDDRILMGPFHNGWENAASLRSPLRRMKRAGANYFALRVRPENAAQVTDFADLTAELGLRFDLHDPEGLAPSLTAYAHVLPREDRDVPRYYPRTGYDELCYDLLSEDPHVVPLGITPLGINTIRGMRIVESRIDLSSLRRATNIGGTAVGGDLQAVVDKDGNYAIFLPGPGIVDIEVEDTSLTRRVTVVGYLGTQRSEVLAPPYDGTLRLESAEEQGGWMLITRMEGLKD